jgi:uncharacterized iron-regulated membrane protein
MKLFRKVLFWCHLITGVLAGLVVLIMSVTGVLLTYEKQIILWADTRNYQVAPSTPGAPRLSVEALLVKVREIQPDATPSAVTLRSDASMPASLAVSGGRTLFANPYTGEILGEGAKGTRAFFRFVTDWHRWLGANGDNRAAARAITGACNLGFLFLVMSGFYLWWPKRLNWSQVRNVIWFKRGLPGKARDFNWHNVIGFWSVVPLFIVVLSATVISYPWASNLVYRVVGETPPAPARPPGAAPQGGGGPQRAGEGAPRTQEGAPRTQEGQARGGGEGQARGGGENRGGAPSFEGIDRMWAVAEAQTSDWQSISLRLPTSADAPGVFTIDGGTGGQPQKRGQLTLNRQTGEVMRWEPFASFTRGRQLRTIMRFAHTGEVAGFFGQTIAGLVSAGGAFLVWTGIALALRRLLAWISRRSKASSKASVPAAEKAGVSIASEEAAS